MTGALVWTHLQNDHVGDSFGRSPLAKGERYPDNLGSVNYADCPLLPVDIEELIPLETGHDPAD